MHKHEGIKEGSPVLCIARRTSSGSVLRCSCDAAVDLAAMRLAKTLSPGGSCLVMLCRLSFYAFGKVLDGIRRTVFCRPGEVSGRATVVRHN